MTNLMTRDDTLLGVCEGLGAEFGFRADLLRVALGVALLFVPWAAIGAYLALGMLLLAARMLWPVADEPVPPAVAAVEPAPLPLAA